MLSIKRFDNWSIYYGKEINKVVMRELIDKAAVVVEIERLREEEYPCDTFEESTGYYNALDEIATFLNTLEVKEVNLDKEIDEWMKYGPHTSYPWCTIPDAIKITAEHFFELGLKTQKGE